MGCIEMHSTVKGKHIHVIYLKIGLPLYQWVKFLPRLSDIVSTITYRMVTNILTSLSSCGKPQ